MRIEMSGWSIVVPEGWTTVIGDKQDRLRLFLDSDVQNGESFHRVEMTGVEVSFDVIHPPTRSTIADYADPVMRRHVGQGTPEVSSRDVCGREARAYGWTNGVQDIESVFVEIPTATSFALLRCDVVVPILADGATAGSQLAAGRVLESLTWH